MSINIEDIGLNQLLSKFVSFNDYFKQSKFYFEDLKEKDGVYAFWWMNDANFELIRSLNLSIEIKGKQNRKAKNIEDKFIIYNTEWDLNPIDNKICLYAGKSNDLAKRIELHLYQSFKRDWYNHKAINRENEKRLFKRTTACQLRAGIEHLYKGKEFNFFDVIRKHIFISFYCPEDLSIEKKMKERFYLEDLAIGYLKPLFNLDSER